MTAHEPDAPAPSVPSEPPDPSELSDRPEPTVPRGVLWFRSVVAHAADLPAVLAGDRLGQSASPASEAILGYAPEELAGQPLGQLSDVDLASLSDALEGQPGVPVYIEGGIRHRDGSMRAFEGTVTNLVDDPVVRGFVVNARDV